MVIKCRSLTVTGVWRDSDYGFASQSDGFWDGFNEFSFFFFLSAALLFRIKQSQLINRDDQILFSCQFFFLNNTQFGVHSRLIFVSATLTEPDDHVRKNVNIQLCSGCSWTTVVPDMWELSSWTTPQGVKVRKRSENRGIQGQFNLLSKTLNVVFNSHWETVLTSRLLNTQND